MIETLAGIVALVGWLFGLAGWIARRWDRQQLSKELEEAEQDAYNAASLALGVIRSVDVAKHFTPDLGKTLGEAQSTLGVRDAVGAARDAIKNARTNPEGAVVDAIRGLIPGGGGRP